MHRISILPSAKIKIEDGVLDDVRELLFILISVIMVLWLFFFKKRHDLFLHSKKKKKNDIDRILGNSIVLMLIF